MKKLIAIACAACAAACIASEDADMLVAGLGPQNYATAVETVRAYAFANVRGITRIEADQAKSVGQCAFTGCRDLVAVSLNSLTDLSRMSGMFSGCLVLEAVYLPLVEFKGIGTMNGFPWGVPEKNVIVRFYFANGVFDRYGKEAR